MINFIKTILVLLLTPFYLLKLIFFDCIIDTSFTLVEEVVNCAKQFYQKMFEYWQKLFKWN